MNRGILYHTPPPHPPFLDITYYCHLEGIIKKGMQNKRRIREAIKRTEIKRVEKCKIGKNKGINLVGAGHNFLGWDIVLTPKYPYIVHSMQIKIYAIQCSPYINCTKILLSYRLTC
jgi:hypothetical protein